MDISQLMTLFFLFFSSYFGAPKQNVVQYSHL